MAYQNLGEFLNGLRKAGELCEVNAEVDPVLEVTEIVDRVVKQKGPALLFKRVKGSDIPLAINLFGSEKRMGLAFGVSDIEEVATRLESFFSPKVPGSLVDKVKLLGKIPDLNALLPRAVKHAPCQEVFDQNPALSKFPVIQCWPKDGGKFITFPLVITQDPETKTRNVGLYRMHVYDDRTTGMHWQIHKDGAEHYRKLKTGEKLEVAVVIGCDPAVMFCAACPLPYGVDEMMLAGFLRRRPVDMVKCKTIDLEVPAESEIVLEGYVIKGEERLEGPFGDHTGYYSRAKNFPVFHIQAMTHRRNPIYVATVVGRPPMEDCYMGKVIERIFLPIIKKQLPEIVDMNIPWEGCFHNCLIVSIRKSYPAHAKKVMSAIWGLGMMSLTRCILVMDEDCNVQDVREVAWRAFNNVDPKRDMVFSEGPIDELDHAANDDFVGSKVGIDCTRKSEADGMKRPWPEDMVMAKEIKELVSRRWREYGL